jgi:CDP-glycerol glycerophosphotransferase
MVIKYILLIILYPFRIFKLNNRRIFLVDNLGYRYCDSPKYISKFLLQNYKDKFEIVFAVSNPELQSKQMDTNIIAVKVNSLKYYYYAMTSKVFVSNSGIYSYLPLRKKQYVINTWHGGGAYKHVGLDVYPNSKTFINDLKMRAKKTDLFLSSCRRFSEIFNTAMLIPNECFYEIGMPRNDIIISNDPDLNIKTKNKLGINPDIKLVLYAPTYRKQNDNAFLQSMTTDYNIDCNRILEALQKRFGGKWCFAFRLHPCIKNRQLNLSGDVLDVSDYEDMQELLCAADVLINDYSSSMWDFSLSGKPCFIFAEDVEHYSKTAKLYTPIKEWPFPLAENNDEMVDNILNFSETVYKERVKTHHQALGCCETGKASELTCKKIYDICFTQEKKNN